MNAIVEWFLLSAILMLAAAANMTVELFIAVLLVTWLEPYRPERRVQVAVNNPSLNGTLRDLNARFVNVTNRLKALDIKFDSILERQREMMAITRNTPLSFPNYGSDVDE